jgi:hypothetical protein
MMVRGPKFYRLFFQERLRSGSRKLLKRLITSAMIFFWERKLRFNLKKQKTYLPNLPGVVLSLTTKPGREKDVLLTLESLLNQWLKPEKIVLWLSMEEFDPNNLPTSFHQLQKRGIEIHFIKYNVKSYNKLLPALKAFPDHIIITADDDILYPDWWVQKMYAKWQENPAVITAYRCFTIDEDIASRNWKLAQSDAPSRLNFPTGVSGILYFPGCFSGDVTRKDLFQELCPTEDDLWFRIQSFRKGVPVRQVFDFSLHFPMLKTGRINALMHTNKYTKDQQFQALKNHYRLSFK